MAITTPPSTITQGMKDTVMILHVRMGAFLPQVAPEALSEYNALIAAVVDLKRQMGIPTKPISPA